MRDRRTQNETARRVRQRIEAVLDFATVRGNRQGDNPARWKGNLELAGLAERPEVENHAALSYAELPAFIASLHEQDGIAERALEFTILTAARTGEVIGATWGEIDGDVWIVPKERMKASREHRVPLSARALEILAEMKRKGAYMFPGAKAGKPLSNTALIMTLRRMDRGDITPHGFRSTFLDWCGDCTEFPREVAVAHEPASDDKFAKMKTGGNPMTESERGELFAPTDEEYIGADHERTGLYLGQGGEGGVEVAFGARVQHMDLEPELAGGRLRVSQQGFRKRAIGRVDEKRDAGRGRDQLVQQLQLLRRDLDARVGHAREVAAGPIQAGDEAKRNRVEPDLEDNRCSCGCRFGGKRRGGAGSSNHGQLTTDQLGCQCR
jgi:Phage integrase family